MEIKELSKENKDILNEFARDSLLSRWEWGEFKEKTSGWQTKRLAVFENTDKISKGPSLAKSLAKKDELVFAMQILIKKLPLGFSFFYSPINLPNEKIFKELLKKVKQIAKEENAMFCQMDILKEKTQEKEKELSKFGFRKSFEEIQPKYTLVLDLTQTEEEILKQMKPKGRYNIKIAQKHNVTIKEIKNLKDFSDYQKIHEETVKRDKIQARSFQYLKSLFSTLRDNNLGTAFIAYYKNQPISGIIVSLASDKATYIYGASIDNFRNVMAPYLLQWKAIKYAKSRGAKIYDFFGIVPTDDPSHKWAGITRFKKQFGGKQIEILGSYDLIFKPLMYNLFKVAMKLRKLK